MILLASSWFLANPLLIKNLLMAPCRLRLTRARLTGVESMIGSSNSTDIGTTIAGFTPFKVKVIHIFTGRVK